MESIAILLCTSLFAGFVGSMMGVGGGIVLVPVLVGFLDVPLRLAIGASMVAVVATSSAAAAAYVRDGFSNLRLGILMSMVTVIGALGGVALGKVSGGRVVTGAFCTALLFAAWAMYRRHRDQPVEPGTGGEMERRWGLSGAFDDAAAGMPVRYGVVRVRLGMLLMLGAGLASGLLGIGGGIIQVPLMDAVMSMPIKAAVGTSNFMMGVTSAAGAVAFFAMGDVHPLVAAPVTVGVFIGSFLGSRVMPRVRDSRLRHMFVIMLLLLAADMGWNTWTG